MASINVDVVQHFLHPPLGLLKPHLDFFGPYSGNATIVNWSITAGPIFTPIAVANTFGVMWTVAGAIPSGRGFTKGWVSPDAQYEESVYEDPLAQLVVQHQFLSGLWVTTQSLWISTFPGTLLWNEALPGRLGLLVSPGIELDLFFLEVN